MPTRKATFLRLAVPLQIIQTAIWTGRVADEIPVSILLVAPQESAKSAVLKYWSKTPTLKYYQDLTAKPLGELRPKIENGDIRHIVLLDLIPVASHAKGASARIFAALGALMEEGQADTADAGGTVEWKGMPNCGILAAITPEAYKDQRRQWWKSGFATRIIKVGFQYQLDTVNLVHDAIRKNHQLPDPRCEKLPGKNVSISIDPKFTRKIQEICQQWATGEQVYGFRFHRRLRTLVKARALISKRKYVIKKDLDEVLSWMPFFNIEPLRPI